MVSGRPQSLINIMLEKKEFLCICFDFRFSCLFTNIACLLTDTLRSRRERRARQRDFIKAQENGIMQESRSRLSVASTSSTSTCSSTGSGQVPANALQDSKYSSLSSLSDTESVGKNFRVVVTGDLILYVP